MKRVVALCAALLAAEIVIAGDRGDASLALADLIWMEGHWVMEGENSRAEEIWTAPLDGSMTGSFRWVESGRMHVLEFLVIEEKNGEVTLRFKHFDKDYRTWEQAAPNTYRLVAVEGMKAVFENVAWNGRVPQRIIYVSPGADHLVFRGESPDDDDGEPLVLEFVRKE